MPPSEPTIFRSFAKSARAWGGLPILLWATLWIPPQVVLWGSVGGNSGSGLGWTVYREPKLAALQILGWTFLAAWVFRQRRWLASRDGRRCLFAQLRHPFFLAFAAFLSYGASTLLWVRVPENLLYELTQYVFLFLFTLTLALWADREPRVRRWLWAGLAFALVPAALLSALQLVGDLPVLRPIDTGLGVRHGSLFGAKNPLALALLGSFFLVVGWTDRDGRGSRYAAVYAAGLIVLIASLQSRTALFALLVVSSLLWLGGWLVPGRRGLRLVTVAGLGMVGLGASSILSPAAGDRARSLAETLRHPTSYLESDRGIYLRNTLHMVSEHPWGVGLGDWQTQYPLARRAGPEAAFTVDHQARRAHSDPVQILGETGWLGLTLWAVLCAVALGLPLRDFVRFRRPDSLILAAQLGALLLAGLFDYLIEQPWHKLQFFGVAVLGLIVTRRSPERRTAGLDGVGSPATGPAAGWAPRLVSCFVTLLAGAGVFHFAQHMVRSQLSAELSARYEVAFEAERAETAGADRRRLWTAVERVGDRLDGLAGHSRTSYRDSLIRARAALALGDRRRAFDQCRQSLRLHPFHPNTYGLLAELRNSLHGDRLP